MVQPSHCCDCNPLELRLQLLCKPLLWNAAVHCCWNLLQCLQACDFIVTFQCLILFWFGSYSHILSWLFFQWLLGFLGVENYWKYNPATLRHSEIGRKRQKNLLLFFFFPILNEVIVCFLCHTHVSGGFIRDVGLLVAGSAAIEFKGLFLSLKYIAAAFIPETPLHNAEVL